MSKDEYEKHKQVFGEYPPDYYKERAPQPGDWKIVDKVLPVDTPKQGLANSVQHGGRHYKKFTMQPWDVVLDWQLGYLDGTALKYISRWRDKGGLEDIRKAIHFLQKLIEVEENKGKHDTYTPSDHRDRVPTDGRK